MSAFQPIKQYRSSTDRYELLPFRFTPLDEKQYVLTNMAGEYVVMSRETVVQLVRHNLSPGSRAYTDLRARHFITDETSRIAPSLLSLKLPPLRARLPLLSGVQAVRGPIALRHVP